MYPQHCAGCLAGDGAAYERAGRGAGDGCAEYATLLIGLLMVRKILKLRGISGEMLKNCLARKLPSLAGA
ncbi:hypothetical protein MJ581_23665 [Escherichia coli]|nr:hypothetical protein MJ581_23665 [Escherichia coli]